MSSRHLSNDHLEEYILGRLCATQTEALEIHILTCARCLSQLEKLEADIRLLKGALSHLISNTSRNAEARVVGDTARCHQS
jgi:anti-sigma factor RsiW